MTPQRISKVMSRAGLCSRRDAERWIEAGRVQVNGQLLTSPVCLVSDSDVILIDGKPLPTMQATRLWIFYKQVGSVTTSRDPEGRPTIFDQLPKNMPRVITIGRLDLNSEGLLLLTNDGELARSLELPKNEWPRTYRVRVYGAPDERRLAALADGITIDGVHYGPVQAEIEKNHEISPPLAGGIKGGNSAHLKGIFGQKPYTKRDLDSMDKAKDLRKNATDAEKILWHHLRSKQLQSYKFRRQQSIGPYIVDFICNDKALIVELDGGQHSTQQEYDLARTEYLEKVGYTVMRFWNHEVFNNLEGIVESILHCLNQSPSPTLPRKRERGQGKNHWLRFTLHEGKNREIRKLCDAMDLKVNRLIRISYGPFSLEKLEPGDVREVSPKKLEGSSTPSAE